MVAAPDGGPQPVDVRDLNSVRRALRAIVAQDEKVAGEGGGPSVRPAERGEVILGEDWVVHPRSAPDRRGGWQSLVTLQRSPLARKIIVFNLIAIILLVMGMLWLAPSRDSLAIQRAKGLVSEAELVADVIEASLPPSEGASLRGGEAALAAEAFARLDLRGGSEAFLFAGEGRLLAQATAQEVGAAGLEEDVDGTLITNGLNALWEAVAGVLSPEAAPLRPDQASAPGLAIPRDLVLGASRRAPASRR